VTPSLPACPVNDTGVLEIEEKPSAGDLLDRHSRSPYTARYLESTAAGNEEEDEGGEARAEGGEEGEKERRIRCHA
jgi:hypothetical protein